MIKLKEMKAGRIIYVTTLVSVIGLFSCEKNENQNSGSLVTSLSTAVGEVVANQVTNVNTSVEHSLSVEKYNNVNNVNLLSGGGFDGFHIIGWGHGHLKFSVPRVDSCATVTVSSNTYPKEIVIEYLKGCSMHHHDRYGKVIINLSDTITNAGAVQTITYENMYQDSMKIDLTASLKNLGKNASGNWVIEKKYTQTITKNSETIVRSNTETAEWISGFETSDKSDNIYYISGSGTITLNDTAKFTRTITTPLLFDASCDYIKSGVVELTRNGTVSTINYGDGTCDSKATITTDGTTEEINLHTYRFKEGGNFGKHCHGFGNGGRG
jgi:hypothetical protein